MSKVKTFAITFRPRGGISDSQISSFVAWAKKKTQFHSIITEKLGEQRHLHAALWLEKAVANGNMGVTLCRLFKDLDPEEKAVFKSGIKVMYNSDWLTNYLSKGDDTVEISNNLPIEGPGYLESYYPPTILPTKKGPGPTDPKYAHFEKLWYEHVPSDVEVTPLNCRHFLFRMMNKDRLIRVIEDDRKIMMISRALARYINKSDWCHLEVPPFDIDK